MSTCPNFSDPNIRLNWDAIVNDPELGRIEAMREFIASGNENRPMRTPAEVKAKLAEEYSPIGGANVENKYNEDRKKILDKSNDPVYDDPNQSLGAAILLNPINGKSPSVQNNSETRAIEILQKLSAQMGVDFAFVSPQQAIEITANSKNPYNVSKGPAFFYGETVYFISGAVNTELAFHEFSHPLIRTIQNTNPVLFERLFNAALAADINLLTEAYNEYTDLREAVLAEQNPERKADLELKYKNLVAEEVLVKALTKAAMLKEQNIQPTSALGKLITDLLYAIKQVLRKMFGQKVSVAKMDVTTTMDQLAQMLVDGKNFEISTDNISNDDVVAYMDTNAKYIEDLKDIADKAGNKIISSMSKRLYEGASQQVRMIMRNKNYSEMIDLFADEYNRGDLQEIRSNIAKYAQDLESKAENLADEIDRTNNEIQALVNSMLRLEVMMEKMEKHLTELAAEAHSQDSAHKAYYYSHVLGYWQKYIEETQKFLVAEKIDSKSPMTELLNRIDTTMKKSALTITDMNQKGVGEVLWEQWAGMAERADNLFLGMIKTLKEKGASQQLLDKRFTEFYGMPEEYLNKYKALKEMKEKGLLTSLEDIDMYDSLDKKRFDGQQMTKEKVERALKGEGKDASWVNSYLEGYLYNTDPVIGGFAMYFKNNMAEMEVRVQARQNEIANELMPLIKDAGINFTRIGGLGESLGFIDKIGVFNTKTNTFEEKKVWTLLNPYKNYRYDVDTMNHDIKILQSNYNKTQNAGDKQKLADKLAEKAAHQRKYFYQEYVDDFYDKDDLLEKDDIGRLAAFERKEILVKMNELTHPLTNEYDILKSADQIDAWWKKYRLLYSLYYPNGEKKTNSFIDETGKEIVTNDLAKAERLQAHRDHTRKFYEFKERPGVFQQSLKNFEAETFEKLKLQKYTPGTEEFDDMAESLRSEWLQRNTRIAIKPEFYAARAKILSRIKEIISKLPSSQANEIDFTEHWKLILDVVAGFRNDDGQPIGTEIPEGRKERVKEAQEAMNAAKAKWAGFSGLTTEDMEKLMVLIAKRNTGVNLTPLEYDEYRRLIEVQDELGLDEYERAELNSLFSDLKELQTKEPTEYYLDTINHWVDSLDTAEIFKELSITEIDASNADRVLVPKILDKLFAQSPAFKEWFEKNHIKKEAYNATTKEKEVVYERLYIWNVIKPVDPVYYESTQITKADGTIETVPGLPTLKYYARVVKKEFRTGYDPLTNEVKPIVGVHKDNRGEYLPKQVAGSPYINEEYFKLKNAPAGSQDAKMFKVLESLTKIHLKNQEGVGKRGKLYLDFPRFEKSNLEWAQTGGVKKKVAEKQSGLSLLLKRISDFFTGAKAGMVDSDFNWSQKNDLVRADAFGDQIENIPIQGLFNLDEEETSTDIITSILRYNAGAEHHKQLVKMNPIAQGIKNVLNNPLNKRKELDKVSLADFKNNGIITYLTKSGKYVRKDAFENFYNREFMSEHQTGAFSGEEWAWLQNIQKFLFKRASFSFFALNIPSALKNAAGAKFQLMLHTVGGNDVNMASMIKGEAWSAKYMMQLSMADAYAKGPKSLDHQIGEIFDPVQGRFLEKSSESITRTMGKDVASMTWLYNFRKWTELQASMQQFGAMMYKKKIPMGNTEIDYIDAWELNKDGKIQLKPGIDAKWGITYTAEGVQVIGKEFLEFRSRIHVVMNKLNGAYSKMDQPELQRFFLFRFISFLRRFFTTMAINRFGKSRWNPGYGEIDEGYYTRAFKVFGTLGRSRNFHDLTIEDRNAWMKMTAEIGSLYMMTMLMSMLWGWDDDDKDRYEKLRQRSGHLNFLGTSENKPGEEFDFGGYMSLHALNLMMQIRSENEQFIPLPKYGLDNITSMMDLKSLAFGPTTDTYSQLGSDIADTWSGNSRQFYARRVGPYEWQDKGGRKLWAHIAKSFGVTGSSIDPAQAITNFQKAQARKK